MKLEIKDRKSISEIQEEFSSLFPYLKVEFFSKPHSVGRGTAKLYMKDTSTLLKDCRTVHTEGELIFDSGITVFDLEKKFHNDYGLDIQVFRKSGNLWLETTATDGWTLAIQNKQGEELNHVQGRDHDEPIDYHEQE